MPAAAPVLQLIVLPFTVQLLLPEPLQVIKDTPSVPVQVHAPATVPEVDPARLIIPLQLILPAQTIALTASAQVQLPVPVPVAFVPVIDALPVPVQLMVPVQVVPTPPGKSPGVKPVHEVP
ncbi:MAG TPA: hypothetical protein VI937_03045 [Negativicutes bacterium]|nr:hypothetical protein [Negativicutes bacterium]